jgi:hypothetical protein
VNWKGFGKVLMLALKVLVKANDAGVVDINELDPFGEKGKKRPAKGPSA